MATSLMFLPHSADLSDLGRSELERVAREINEQRIRRIELRAYAGDSDPMDARKVALARALSVRSYLVDLKVKAQIDIGAFAAAAEPMLPERVEIWLPGR